MPRQLWNIILNPFSQRTRPMGAKRPMKGTTQPCPALLAGRCVCPDGAVLLCLWLGGQGGTLWPDLSGHHAALSTGKGPLLPWWASLSEDILLNFSSLVLAMSKSGQPLGLAGSAVPWPDAQFPSQHCPHRNWGPCVPTAANSLCMPTLSHSQPRERPHFQRGRRKCWQRGRRECWGRREDTSLCSWVWSGNQRVMLAGISHLRTWITCLPKHWLYFWRQVCKALAHPVPRLGKLLVRKMWFFPGYH